MKIAYKKEIFFKRKILRLRIRFRSRRNLILPVYM